MRQNRDFQPFFGIIPQHIQDLFTTTQSNCSSSKLKTLDELERTFSVNRHNVNIIIINLQYIYYTLSAEYSYILSVVCNWYLEQAANNTRSFDILLWIARLYAEIDIIDIINVQPNKQGIKALEYYLIDCFTTMDPIDMPTYYEFDKQNLASLLYSCRKLLDKKCIINSSPLLSFCQIISKTTFAKDDLEIP